MYRYTHRDCRSYCVYIKPIFLELMLQMHAAVLSSKKSAAKVSLLSSAHGSMLISTSMHPRPWLMLTITTFYLIYRLIILTTSILMPISKYSAATANMNEQNLQKICTNANHPF
jgi:cellulose synthase/poly-beta-1,6-N-acetylglucosamine synthase-like glycosyltransferase